VTGAEAVQIRPAGPDDADPLGRCHVDCWREAYRGLVDGPGFRAELTRVDERVERWRQVLGGPHGTVVAVSDGDVVGFASAGPQRDDDVDLPLELYALYVRQARWGTGLGHRLLEAVVRDAPGSLWVLGTNERARTFYSRHGYRCDGAEKHDDVFGTEVRMVRRPVAGATAG